MRNDFERKFFGDEIEVAVVVEQVGAVLDRRGCDKGIHGIFERKSASFESAIDVRGHFECLPIHRQVFESVKVMFYFSILRVMASSS